MQKEECIEISERYIQNQANPDEAKRLSLWIKNNQEISSWLEQEIIASPSVIDNDVQTRIFRNIENKIDIKDRIEDVKLNQTRLQLNKWLRIAAMFILPVLTAACMYFYMATSDRQSTGIRE